MTAHRLVTYLPGMSLRWAQDCVIESRPRCFGTVHQTRIQISSAEIRSLCIREREFCAECLRGNVLPLSPRTSVHPRYRARGADHSAIESRTPDVGVKEIRSLEIGLPETGPFDARVGLVRIVVVATREAS